LAEAGINLTEVADYLLAQGVQAMADPFRQRHPPILLPQAALVGAESAALPGG